MIRGGVLKRLFTVNVISLQIRLLLDLALAGIEIRQFTHKFPKCLIYRGLLIAIKLDAAKDMSLPALIYCGASINFVWRLSLDDSTLQFIMRKILPTRMAVRLATGASVTVMKCVVWITYALKKSNITMTSLYWNWMTNFMLNKRPVLCTV